MPRLAAALFALVTAAVALPAAAASLTDPAEMVGMGRLRLDGEADVTLGRNLRFEDTDARFEVEGRTFALTGGYGLLPDMDGFLTLGAARLRVEEPAGLPGGAFDGDVGLSFGGGVRYRFVNERLFKVGARAQLTRRESQDDDVTATWLEYDLLLGASLHASRALVPFLALGASLIDGDLAGPFGRVDFRQEDVVGAVVGLRYAATSQVHGTLTGRFFDQTSVGFALSFAF